jgi:sulfotransferase family protein
MSRADSPLHGRMIFNVGARRSGTFWLQRIVAAHPEVAAVPSETHLFSHGLAPLFERFQHSLRSSTKVGEVYVEREPLLDAVRDLCDVVFAGILTPGATRLAERTPMHVLHLELIAAVYPDARFVHIIRDGRDVARSLVTQDWGPDTIDAAATEWRDAILAARQAALPADSYREVRYEALLQDPRPVVSDLYAWLDLEATDKVIAEALGEAGIGANLGVEPSGIGPAKWRDSYSKADLTAFDRVAGELLAELGYPPSGDVGTRVPMERGAGKSLTRLRNRLLSLRRPHLRRGRVLARPRALQELVERAVHALQDGTLESLEAALADDALIRVIGRDGDEQARGERGRELLRRVVGQRPGFSGRQVRGDLYLALPYAAAVLTYRERDGALHEPTIVVGFQGQLIGELIVYSR